MDLFIQVKKAYDILSDPRKRAIYDVIGMKGLKTEGWEVRIYHRIRDYFNSLLLIDSDSNKNSS